MDLDNYAILIDGDNINSKYADNIISRVREMGNIMIKRIYGDFSKPEFKNWREPCIDHSIESRHIWSNTTGKNTTDMFIVTDCCFDIDKHNNIHNYVIVSGDGDFSVLISALKRIGRRVIGMSMNYKHTSKTLLNCCDRFIYLDTTTETPSVAIPISVTGTNNSVTVKTKTDSSFAKVVSQSSLTTNVRTSVNNSVATDSDTANTLVPHININVIQNYIQKLINESTESSLPLSIVKSKILQKWVDFSEELYGYKSFTSFAKSMTKFTVTQIDTTRYISPKE